MDARGPVRRLDREFTAFYTPVRRPGFPHPSRLLGLCRHLYRRYRRRLSAWEFFAAAYEVLDGRPGRGRGLVNDFDPDRYRGRLRAEDHFVNMFARRLRAGLARSRRWGTRRGWPEDRADFPHRPALGLHAGGGHDPRPRVRRQQADADVAVRPHGGWSRRTAGADLRASLPEALATLGGVHSRVIALWYWEGLSARAIGLTLGLDHKTVRRRHDEALDRLRAYYADELSARVEQAHSPKQDSRGYVLVPEASAPNGSANHSPVRE
jgi:DNA-directed RNA polymerase specialized sigma24 family protein